MEIRTQDEQKQDLREMARLAEQVNGKHCYKCDGSGQDGWITHAKQYAPCVCIVKATNVLAEQKQRQLEEENQQELKTSPILDMAKKPMELIRKKMFLN